MVKPPKTMQPEGRPDNVKQRQRRGMEQDSFHNYMARKIELQRQQFGLLIPPPPPIPTEKEVEHDVSMNSMDQPTSMQQILQNLQRRHGMGRPSSSSKKRKATSTQASPSQRPRKDLFFSGIVVKFQGFTQPDPETLKRMLQRHGGDVETYETSRVTHLVAEQVSKARMDIYQKRTRPTGGPPLLVRPAWIVDSVQAGRKLSPHTYSLIPAASDKTISSFFGSSTMTSTTTTAAAVDAASLEHEASPRADSTLSERDEPCETSTMDMLQEQEPMAWMTQVDACTTPTKAWNQEQGTSNAEKLSVVKEDDRLSPIIPPLHCSPKEPLHQTEYPKQATAETLSMASSAIVSVDRNVELPRIVPLPTQKSSPTRETEGIQQEDTSSSTPSFPESIKDSNATTPTTALTTTAMMIATVDSDPQTHHELPQQPSPSGRTDSKYIRGKLRTSGTDPNFLQSFFASSRLSFIGSFQQRQAGGASAGGSRAVVADGIMPPPPARGVTPKATNDLQRWVFHVDMDCFFANVVLRKYPQHRDRPVVISHQTNTLGASDLNAATTPNHRSTSECATCNYHARKYGIRKGMYLGQARQLCPDLVVLPYDFEGYEQVSEQVLAILQQVAMNHQGNVEAVSCDEAYLELFVDDSKAALQLTEAIRGQIWDTTSCTASVGVGANKLLAKLGTDHVKPNASYVVESYQELLQNLKLGDLPGIGYRSKPKLREEGLETVGDVWELGKSQAESTLTRILGPGLGKKILGYCHGQDERKVQPAERKTIGAECSYGVRFDEGPYGIDYFILGLSTEVEKRMENVGVRGCKVTLKVKQRKEGAKAPPKFLGHGSCHNHSKSADLPCTGPTRDATLISTTALKLFHEMGIAVNDVRGVGVIISKLESDSKRQASIGNAPAMQETGVAAWLASASTKAAGNLKEKTPEPAVDDSPTPQNSDDGMQTETTKQFFIQEDLTPDFPDDVDMQQEDDSDFVTGDAPFAQTSMLLTHPSDMALPPLSQIHMSQVAALPKEMRDVIQAKLSSRRRNDALAEEDVAVTDDPGIALVEEPATVAQYPQHHGETSNSSHRQHQFRQTNVKRMMKLAAVRSGQAKVDISLTQLDELPLEIKLQVVNDDSQSVGERTQETSKLRRVQDDGISGSRRKGRRASLRPDSDMEYKRKSLRPSTALPTISEPRMYLEVDDDKDDTVEVLSQEPVPTKNEQEEEIELVPVRNTWEQDLVPFQRFLHKHNPDEHSIAMVQTFLKVCLKENRMNVMLTLIRSMRNRSDAWSEPETLSTVLNAVNQEHIAMYGFGIQWEDGKIKEKS
eukprot:Nitzschia sp. Nitz4//scaffold134_size62860//8067//12052//NITZ4_006321-RA/size62860-processed-gene-0.71-mRNA-1//1//CDS//3329535475//7334//frame0